MCIRLAIFRFEHRSDMIKDYSTLNIARRLRFGLTWHALQSHFLYERMYRVDPHATPHETMMRFGWESSNIGVGVLPCN